MWAVVRGGVDGGRVAVFVTTPRARGVPLRFQRNALRHRRRRLDFDLALSFVFVTRVYPQVEIPNALPLIYRFDSRMRPVTHVCCFSHACPVGAGGVGHISACRGGSRDMR